MTIIPWEITIKTNVFKRKIPIILITAILALLAVVVGFDQPTWGKELVLPLSFILVAFVGFGAIRQPLSAKSVQTQPRDNGEHRKQKYPAIARLIERFPEPALLIDNNKIIKLANSSAHEIFNTIAIDKPFYFRFRDPVLISTINQALKENRTTTCQYQMVTPTKRWLSFYFIPLGKPKKADKSTNNPPGKPSGKAPGKGYGVFVHITEQTQNRQIEQLHGEFIANVSHELRTPLSSIIGFIETLKASNSIDPVAQKQFLTIMLNESHRMSGLIDNLLTLSHLELKSHLTPKALINLGQVVEQVITVMKPIATRHSITVEILKPFPTSKILGDYDELIRLFTNIISNAIKYSYDGGKIIISFAKTPEAHHVVIRDYGIGIAEDHLPRLTERFYRVEPGEKTKGTGLGLAIVRQILNHHRGELIITSRLAKGSTFTVSLPRQHDIPV